MKNKLEVCLSGMSDVLLEFQNENPAGTRFFHADHPVKPEGLQEHVFVILHATQQNFLFQKQHQQSSKFHLESSKIYLLVILIFSAIPGLTLPVQVLSAFDESTVSCLCKEVYQGSPEGKCLIPEVSGHY